MSALLAGACAGAAVWCALRPPARLRASRAEAERTPTERSAWLPVAGALSVGVGVTVFVGGVVGVVVGPVSGVLAWLVVKRMESPASRRRRESLESGLSQVVDLLAACLSAGQAPAPALDVIARALDDGPVADELLAISRRLRLGVDPVAVWREVGRHPQLGPLGRCISRAVDSGASVSGAMTRLAEDLRRDDRVRLEGRARSVGVKAALPLGVCMLPAFVLVGVVPMLAGSLSSLVAP